MAQPQATPTLKSERFVSEFCEEPSGQPSNYSPPPICWGGPRTGVEISSTRPLTEEGSGPGAGRVSGAIVPRESEVIASGDGSLAVRREAIKQEHSQSYLPQHLQS